MNRQATGGRTASRLLLLAAALAGAFLTLLTGAGSASAHAALVGSDPKQGAVVEQAPQRVTLTFSEKIAVSDDSVRVLDPAGKRVDTGKLSDLSSGSKARYRVELHSGLPNGTFTVTYQVISADSHPVSGAYTFSIGAASKTTAAVPQQDAGGGIVGTLYGIARYVAYAGFTLLVGGGAFVLGCWPRGARVRQVQRVVVYGWVGLTASTLALLLLRGSYTGSGKLADVFDMGALGDVFQSKPGAALVSRLLLLAVAALFVVVLFGTYAGREDAKERRDLTFGLAVGGAVVAIGLAATWALAEHASVGIQPGLSMPLDILHLLAVATWLGGLTALLVSLHQVPTVEASAVRRFSRTAFTSVIVLAATGLYQAWRQVGSWSALGSTTYGRLLLIKVGLVAVLVCTAAFSRRWTARLTERDTERVAAREAMGAVGAPEAAATATGPAAPETETAPESGTEAAPEAGTATPSVPAQKPARSRTSAGSGTGPSAPAVDAVRAAQLARQRAAVSTATEKRVRDADTSRSGLRRSVLVEAGVAVVLLGVTTLLTTTEPGRTEEEAAHATSASAPAAGAGQPVSLKMPFDTGGTKGKGTVLIDMDPGHSGSNEVHLYAERPDGSPFDLPEIKLALTLPAKQVGPLPVEPDHIASGHWSASGVQLPMAGDWKVSVTVRTSDIDQVTVTKHAKIG
ncbi:hypothetical protein B1H18_14670 [Streptomyces tsukubensis]|uniref:Protein YobA n=1 Tax=Streptomyces tsukubensis TaxID=83656 RepID=A0A1V4A9Q6_9ACTN|nr:hypothetical protein B1H18_14670 [Streptomyces tsukubensis]